MKTRLTWICTSLVLTACGANTAEPGARKSTLNSCPRVLSVVTRELTDESEGGTAHIFTGVDDLTDLGNIQTDDATEVSLPGGQDVSVIGQLQLPTTPASCHLVFREGGSFQPKRNGMFVLVDPEDPFEPMEVSVPSDQDVGLQDGANHTSAGSFHDLEVDGERFVLFTVNGHRRTELYAVPKDRLTEKPDSLSPFLVKHFDGTIPLHEKLDEDEVKDAKDIRISSSVFDGESLILALSVSPSSVPSKLVWVTFMVSQSSPGDVSLTWNIEHQMDLDGLDQGEPTNPVGSMEIVDNNLYVNLAGDWPAIGAETDDPGLTDGKVVRVDLESQTIVEYLPFSTDRDFWNIAHSPKTGLLFALQYVDVIDDAVLYWASTDGAEVSPAGFLPLDSIVRTANANLFVAEGDFDVLFMWGENTLMAFDPTGIEHPNGTVSSPPERLVNLEFNSSISSVFHGGAKGLTTTVGPAVLGAPEALPKLVINAARSSVFVATPKVGDGSTEWTLFDLLRRQVASASVDDSGTWTWHQPGSFSDEDRRSIGSQLSP